MKTIFNTTVVSDPARAYRIRNELAAWDPRLAHLPDPDATPEPPAAAVPSADAEGEPGPAPASKGPLSADAEPAGPGGPVTPEEVAAGFGPAPVVEHGTGTDSPMATCQQPEAHGVWEDARGPLPAECDVPEHHEPGQAPEQADAAPDAEPQP